MYVFCEWGFIFIIPKVFSKFWGIDRFLTVWVAFNYLNKYTSYCVLPKVHVSIWKSLLNLPKIINKNHIHLFCRQGLLGNVVVKQVYFLISLIWIVVRFTWMVLAAAEVHVQSKNALQYIHTCHSRFYNIEVSYLKDLLSASYWLVDSNSPCLLLC